jgi:hypothetical protein
MNGIFVSNGHDGEVWMRIFEDPLTVVFWNQRLRSNFPQAFEE